ncbi:MAG: CCA tRNA nucleotidyltransferase [Acidobacteriota bacterium]
MQLPEYVVKVINTLKLNNHEAYVVGGCVRDLLMGKEPKDYDIATSASPQEVISYFHKTVPIGEKHGTIAVLLDGETVEVTTFKEADIAAQSALENDLLMRDFTINAMAADNNGTIIDPYGGQADLRDRIIRSPQEQAQQRFCEDPLRMLRAIRFCSIYGFDLHPTVIEAIIRQCEQIQRVSAERVREELNRILLSERAAPGMRMLAQLGLLEYIMPEAAVMVDFDQHNKRHNKDIFEHTMAVLEAVPPRLNARLAALLHDIGKPATFNVDDNGVGHFYGHHMEGRRIAEEILRRLKYDNKTIEDVSILVAEHMSRFSKVRNATLKKLVNRVGEHNLEDLFAVQRADILGSAPPFDFTELDAMQEGVERIKFEQLPMLVKDLEIDGYDLMELGFERGPKMGEVLNYLLDAVLEKPELNERETLLAMAMER